MKRFIVLIMLMSVCLSAQNKPTPNDSIPHLKNQGSTFQLIVNGKPLLMLAGETGNSSASDLKYMSKVWPAAAKMHLNTIVVPVYWEFLETREGLFDYTLVDSLITSARQYKMKLVFLWFGTWKNSMSCYVPMWIKTDQQRFPRARQKNGKAEEILTAFSTINRNTDARAFAALMKHIKEFDAKEQTVVLVQVENEIGMIPDARDYCESANGFFNSPVPDEFIKYLTANKENLHKHLFQLWEKNGFKIKGNWEEIFGKSLYTDEIFMAWYYAKYSNFVAEAGKKEYPLPMYVNAALIRPGSKPGQYPSAGPLPHLVDIWKAAAPQIDFLAPDVYFKNFAEWIEKFDLPAVESSHKYNPLFIPEVGNDQSPANAFYAIAQHNAMGYSPFSIESLPNPENNLISKAYDVLTQLTPLIISNQGKSTMAGILLDSIDQKTRIKLGEFIFNVSHGYSWKYASRTEGENPRFGGMIIMTAPDEFYIAGRGLIVEFESASNDNSLAGIGMMEEGKFIDGKWVPGLRMNGDQSHQGRHMELPGYTFSIQKVKLYKYK